MLKPRPNPAGGYEHCAHGGSWTDEWQHRLQPRRHSMIYTQLHFVQRSRDSPTVLKRQLFFRAKYAPSGLGSTSPPNCQGCLVRPQRKQDNVLSLSPRRFGMGTCISWTGYTTSAASVSISSAAPANVPCRAAPPANHIFIALTVWPRHSALTDIFWKSTCPAFDVCPARVWFRKS